MTLRENTGPIEVWLAQSNIAITCRIVFEDESTDKLEVDSLSMRGAQREITGHLLQEGYQPVGRWDSDAEGETVRRFTRKPAERARDNR